MAQAFVLRHWSGDIKRNKNQIAVATLVLSDRISVIFKTTLVLSDHISNI